MAGRSAKEHGEVVLGAIIPGRIDLLDKATKLITADHFTDATSRAIFSMLVKYLELTGSVMSRSAMIDMIKGADAGKIALVSETFEFLYSMRPEDHDFSWSLEQLRELHAERSVSLALTESMEILTTGVNESGNIIKGQKAAREYLLERLSYVERSLYMQESPEGDMRDEREDMRNDYERKKQQRQQGQVDGIMFGIPELDIKTGGLQNGELDLVIGTSSSGKSSLVVQLAWYAAVVQHKNVVIATTETLREQMRRKMLARHSKHDKFELSRGLNSKDIKNGSLLPEQEEKLFEVIDDFTYNKDYGHCYILQVPKGSTITSLEGRLNRLQRDFNIDLVIMDYLALLKADRKRQTQREELASIIVEAKQLATTFDDGRGVPVVSPWQVSRSAWEEAQKSQAYALASLAETAEAERSSDVVISILEPLQRDGRYATIKSQVLKNRDGEQASSIMLTVDYATSSFDPFEDANDLDDLLSE